MPELIDTLIGNADAFPILKNWDFFNHAGVSPIPRVAADAIRQYAAESEQGAYMETHWYKQIELLRASAAKLINADKDEIALVKNTGEGLSIVANGIAWKPGDRIVTTNVEYPSNIYPWMDVANRFGAELITVPEEISPDGAARASLEKILQAADHPRTRMLTISHAEYASGQRHDIAAIGAYCRSRNILICVDAIQTLGILPVDVQAMKIDYLSADGHKWLLGPEGCGILFVRKELQGDIEPVEFGWTNVAKYNDYASRYMTLRPDAGRYECGTLNTIGCYGLRASIELLLDVGVPAIGAAVQQLGDLVEMVIKRPR